MPAMLYMNLAEIAEFTNDPTDPNRNQLPPADFYCAIAVHVHVSPNGQLLFVIKETVSMSQQAR